MDRGHSGHAQGESASRPTRSFQAALKVAIQQTFGQVRRYHQGALVIKRGGVDIGMPLLRAGFDELGEARSAVFGLIELLMPEALGRAGQIAEGLAAIEEAINHSENTEERWMIAEMLRIKGELLLLQGGPTAAASAEDHFRQALDWAAGQGRAFPLGTACCHEPCRVIARPRPFCRMRRLFSSLSSPGLPKGSRRLTLKHRRRFLDDLR